MWWRIVTRTMASAMALLIAFGAYSWQKQQDRNLQLQLEKRKAYDGFLSAASDCFTALIMARNARDGGAEVLRSANTFHFSMEKHKTSLACYGTPQVLEQCYRYVDCLDIYRSHLNERRLSSLAPGVESLSEDHAFLYDARIRAVVLAWSDALGISADHARLVLKGIFASDE